MLEDANLADDDYDGRNVQRSWGTSITVGGTTYATSLFWQPLQNVTDPFQEVEDASEGVLEGADLFCIKGGKAPQFGICVSHEGYKGGEAVAAVSLATAMSNISSYVAVFKTPQGWWYTCIRNDIILSDGDMLFLNEQEAKDQFLSMLAVPDWGRKIAPPEWGIEETEYPDLIISDVMMPGMQGDDFCNTVKEKPETAGIPIILLTAKTNHEAVVAGLRKGADDYLTKPFSTEILKLKIKGMIDNRKRMREYLLRHAVNKIDTVGNTANKNNDEMSQPQNEETKDVNLSENDRMFVDKATDIVLQNISNTDFSIDILCREMAMSRTLFYSRLKSLTGRAPQEFIRIIRLERAAELLKQGISVIDVSEATGFINVKYFSTVFKKYFGIQPSKFPEGKN